MKRLVGLVATLGVMLGLFGGGSSALAAPTLSPPAADFGSQLIGATSAPRTFVLTAGCQTLNPINSGQCFIPDFITPAPATTGDFSVAENKCPPLLVGGIAPVPCAITVTFKPTAAGPRTGTLVAGGLVSALTGIGAAPPVVTPPVVTPPTPPVITPAPKKKKKCGKRKGQKAKGSAAASAKGKRCGKRK